MTHYERRTESYCAMFKSSDEERVSLPTFRQLAAQNFEFDRHYYITGFWFPGQFKQLTIQTDEFKIGLDARSNNVQQLICQIHLNISEGKVMKILVTKDETAEWELIVDDDFEVEWRYVAGDSGAFTKGKMQPKLPPSISPSKRKSKQSP